MDKRMLTGLEKFIGEYAKMARRELETFDPVAIIKPVDMLMNRYDFEYWPNGWQHGNADELKDAGWDDILDKLSGLPVNTRLELSFAYCSEWITCYDLYKRRTITMGNSRRERPPYTEEQAARYKEQTVKEWPWVEKLWNGSEAGAALREMLTEMPQEVFLTVGDLQKGTNGQND